MSNDTLTNEAIRLLRNLTIMNNCNYDKALMQPAFRAAQELLEKHNLFMQPGE